MICNMCHNNFEPYTISENSEFSLRPDGKIFSSVCKNCRNKTTIINLEVLRERKQLAERIAMRLKQENQYTFREMTEEQLSNKILTILGEIK